MTIETTYKEVINLIKEKAVCRWIKCYEKDKWMYATECSSCLIPTKEIKLCSELSLQSALNIFVGLESTKFLRRDIKERIQDFLAQDNLFKFCPFCSFPITEVLSVDC